MFFHNGVIIMKSMNKNSKIYVAGHTGMVGSAIVRNLKIKVLVT